MRSDDSQRNVRDTGACMRICESKIAKFKVILRGFLSHSPIDLFVFATSFNATIRMNGSVPCPTVFV